MKAVVWTEYGPPEVLQLGEVEKSVLKDNDPNETMCIWQISWDGNCVLCKWRNLP